MTQRSDEQIKKYDDYLEKYGKGLFWGSFLVLVKGAYTDLLISCVAAIMNPVRRSTFGHDLKSGEVASFYSAIASLPIILLVVPGLSFWMIFKNKEHLTKAKDCYGSLFEDMRIETKWQRFGIFYYFLRRALQISLILFYL